jgi:hypothetical protein
LSRKPGKQNTINSYITFATAIKLECFKFSLLLRSISFLYFT